MPDETRRWLSEGERAGIRFALQTPRQAPVGVAGGSVSQRAGSSLEFRDHRDYQPGDDLRHIDWNAYARSDQLTIKLYREEVTPHLDVLLDVSRSMMLEGTAKGQATLALAAFFAAAARNAGFSHAAWQMGHDVGPIGNGSGVPLSWEGIAFEHRGAPAGLARAGSSWKPRGVRVLLSDLLWEGDPLVTLRPLAERASVTLVLQVLANVDARPPQGQSLRLVDAETNLVREIHIDALVARRYHERLAHHQENWHAACRQVGGAVRDGDRGGRAARLEHGSACGGGGAEDRVKLGQAPRGGRGSCRAGGAGSAGASPSRVAERIGAAPFFVFNKNRRVPMSPLLLPGPAAAEQAPRLFCTFRLGDQLFGVDIGDVKEVNTETTLTRIHHAPAQVLGCVNLRGNIFLVLDIRRLLGLAPAGFGPDSRLLIFKPHVGDAVAGLVDQIGDIVAVAPGRIEPWRADRGAERLPGGELIAGIAQLEQDLLLILEANLFLRVIENNLET